MSGIVTTLGVVIPIAELLMFAVVAHAIGVGPMILVLIGVSLLGAALLMRQGIGTWRRLRAAVARREVPTDELADAALVMVGGFLLLIPGFITDGLAFLVVIPPTRRALRRALRAVTAFLAAKRFGWRPRTVGAGPVYDTTATTKTPPGSDPFQRPAQLPSSGRPSGADDSLDKG